MEKGASLDGEEPDRKQPEEEAGLDWLLRKDSEIPALPMDSNVSLSSPCIISVDNVPPTAFTRDGVFKAVSQGDAAQLHGLLRFLRTTDKRLTSPDFTDETNGKTALMKALLNLKDGKNDCIEVLLDIAAKTGDLGNFINASYKDHRYKGQTALHIAIERRSFDHVKLLVQKGADIRAKARGSFFQDNGEAGFYFGELPLSLAACTNQPDVVSFLVENSHGAADLTDKDSRGNTALHALVVVVDNTTENTDVIARMYDLILLQHNKLEKTRRVNLEAIENNKGLTPLKLAAKLGKIGLFRHILNREFMDKEARPLSRKFTEWVYGPVHCSLYDMTSIDTNEPNSVLEIVVCGSENPNRPEMLKIEPLNSLLQDKWKSFASKLFLMNFFAYLLYLAVFSSVAFYRKHGTPPFPVEDKPLDHLRCAGELISVLGAVRFLYKTINIFYRNPPKFKSLITDGFSEFLFFTQAVLLLISVVLYFSGRREYVGLLVLSLALAWFNVLYYTRGSKQLGMYNVMMQRMILGDLLHFLCVYSVLLFGFSAAVVTLIDDKPAAGEKPPNDTRARGRSFGAEPFAECKKPSYNDIGFTTLELFKFTIGMGDLEFTDQVQYKEVFYVLIIGYIVLTYILLLNMLIALMGNTVERISEQNETIWNLQRAFTILDMERSLPRWLRNSLYCSVSDVVCFKNDLDKARRFVRVSEMNWEKWRSDLTVKLEEDPEDHMMKLAPHGTLWNTRQLLESIRSRRGRRQPTNIL